MFKKIVIKNFIFFIILMFINSIVSPVFIIKTEHRKKLFQGLYENTGDVYDVVFLGSSHMHGTMNPNVLWGKYGITSFNYATGGQPIDVTYYLLKEVLKKQKSPIVVVDLYYLGLTSKFGEEGYIRYALDNMKTSINKVEAVLNCTPRPHWISYIFPIVKYHSRWKDLKEEDFKFNASDTYYAKGFAAEHELYGKDNLGDTSTSETAELPLKSEEYLLKIIDLSKKEGFKLVFINAPYDYSSTKKLNNWHKEPAKMFNKVAEIAKENNIPFINYNNKLEELGFDFKSDMFNEGHMNIWGADKVTTDFGKFLKENYNITDHRGDEKYARWNSDYIYYSRTEAGNILKAEKDIEKYTKLLMDKNYIVVINSNNNAFSDKGAGVEKALNQLGLRFNKGKNNKNYFAVINNNKVELEMMGSNELSSEHVFDNNTVLNIKTSSNGKNMPGIFFNGINYTRRYNSFNIVVYDKVLKSVVDRIYLDNNNIIKRK